MYLQAIAPIEMIKGYRFSFAYSVNGGPVIAQHKKFVGAEIAEYNPPLDQDNKTQQLIATIISQLF